MFVEIFGLIKSIYNYIYRKKYIDAYKEKLNKRVPNYFSDRLSKMDKVIIYGNDNISDEFKIVLLTQEDILADDWCFYNEEVSNDQNNNK